MSCIKALVLCAAAATGLVLPPTTKGPRAPRLRAATSDEPSYGKRAIRADKVGNADVLVPDNKISSVVAFLGFQAVLGSEQCPEKAGGDICGLSTIGDWNPDGTTLGVALLATAAWLTWYGTFRRLAIDPQGISVVNVDNESKDGLEVSTPDGWLYGGPDRVEFKDVDDWAVLPGGPLYVREVTKTSRGTLRKIPYVFAPSFDAKTVEELLGGRYGVKQADPADSVLGAGSKAGAAGVVSYIAWEWAFWIGSFAGAAALFALYEGHAPDLQFALNFDGSLPPKHVDLIMVKGELKSVDVPVLPFRFVASNADDLGNIATTAFLVVNVARLLLPLRLGLALATAPFFERTVVTPFNKAFGGA